MNRENKEQPKVAESGELDSVVTQDKSKRKRLLLAIVGIVLVLLAAIIVGVNVLGNSDRKLQEQLDLGAKYLEEMDYEQALVAFNAVLSIEPQNVDAYLGIVEVYIRTNEYESALEYAKGGYEITGDERLKEKIDMIESGDIFASNGWVMRMSSYDGNGNLLYWHEFTYNLKGQQASVTKCNAQGVQEQYLELTYDENGRLLVSYDVQNGELCKKIREYNGDNYREIFYEGTSDIVSGYCDVEVESEGRVYRRMFYDKDGHMRGTSDIWEYDSGGKLIKISEYDENNELRSYCIYTYGEDGKELQMQWYDRNGIPTSYSECIYDEEGKYRGYRMYNAEGVLQWEEVVQ